MVGLVSCMSVDQRCAPRFKMHGSFALVSVVYTIRWRHVRKKKATTQCHLFHHDHVLLHLGHPPRHLTTNIGPRPERIHQMRMRRGHLHVIHGPLGGVQQDYHMYTHSISIHKHRIMHEHILENTHTLVSLLNLMEPLLVFLPLQLVESMRAAIGGCRLVEQHPNPKIQKYPESRTKDPPIFMLWQVFFLFFHGKPFYLCISPLAHIFLSPLNSFR